MTRRMSCEVEEVERSISVFKVDIDSYFVRGLKLSPRGSQ